MKMKVTRFLFLLAGLLHGRERAPAASDPLIYLVKIQGSCAALNFRENADDSH